MKSRFIIIAVLLTALAMLAFTATRTITGKVTDRTGQPLPGVSVTLEGSSLGTVTDGDGNYSITIDRNDGKLRFTFIGYKEAVEKINGRSVINVKMTEDQAVLS